MAVANRLASALVQIDAAKRSVSEARDLACFAASSSAPRPSSTAAKRGNRRVPAPESRSASGRPAQRTPPASASSARCATKLVQPARKDTSQTSRRPGSGATDPRLIRAGGRRSGCAEREDAERSRISSAALEAAATLSREEYLGLKQRSPARRSSAEACSTRSPAVACRCSTPPSRPRARWAHRWRNLALGLAASLRARVRGRRRARAAPPRRHLTRRRPGDRRTTRARVGDPNSLAAPGPGTAAAEVRLLRPSPQYPLVRPRASGAPLASQLNCSAARELRRPSQLRDPDPAPSRGARDSRASSR